jgi:hypothetical protein
MLANGSKSNSEALFNLIEADLWNHADRLTNQSGSSLTTIGYHKFGVPGLQSTGIALSIQLSSGIGFCRYASIIVPEQMIRLELAYFVSGSRQRFMLLSPELDSAITTMQNSQAEPLNGDELWRGHDAPWLKTAKFLDSDNLVFVECDSCGGQLLWSAILEGKCNKCGGNGAKCATIGCSNPWHLGIRELQREAFRESRLAARGRVSARSVYDKGVLCESCRCSLFIPGTMVARLINHPTQSVPIIVNHRPALWMLWTLGCSYRLFFVGGEVSNYLISAVAFVTTIEPFDPKADDPMSGWGKLLHFLAVFPLILTLTAIFGNADYSMSLIALAGSSAILCGTIQGFNLRCWYRKKHWLYSSITASIYVLIIFARVFHNGLGKENRMLLASITIATVCAVASIFLRRCKRVTGELDPRSLWAYKKWF